MTLSEHWSRKCLYCFRDSVLIPLPRSSPGFVYLAASSSFCGCFLFKGPDRTTLTKADLLFHSCILQLASLYVLFLAIYLFPLPECKHHEGTLTFHLVPSLFSQCIKQFLAYSKCSINMLNEGILFTLHGTDSSDTSLLIDS